LTLEWKGKKVTSYHKDLPLCLRDKEGQLEFEDIWTPDKNWIVVDVGAHIGLFTLMVADKVSKVYALEPMSQARNSLTRNLEINNITNVVVLEKALSTYDGQMKLWLDEWGSGGHTALKYMFKYFEEVPCITWDTFCKTFDLRQIDLLKIHTEGTELELLKSINNNLPKRIIIAWWHGYEYTDFSKQKEELISELKKKGYVIRKETKENLFGELT